MNPVMKRLSIHIEWNKKNVDSRSWVVFPLHRPLVRHAPDPWGAHQYARWHYRVDDDALKQQALTEVASKRWTARINHRAFST